MLLAYFGEIAAETCGICDYCLQLHKKEATAKEFSAIREAIERTLKNGPCSQQELMERLRSFPETKVLFVIRTLLDEGLLLRNEPAGDFLLPSDRLR